MVARHLASRGETKDSDDPWRRPRGGIAYTDGQFDDARLAITLALTLADLGGTVLNKAPVTGLAKRNGRTSGVIARDDESGEELTVEARAVINATGIHVDAVRRFDDAGAPPLLTVSQGAHLVLDRSFLPGRTALLVPKTEDGRVLFAIPWHDRVLVGTTDTPTSERACEPRPLAAEVAYMTEYVERYLDRSPGPSDILSTFAGLRPLLRGRDGAVTSKLSREHAVVISDSGLVTVTGGKWTTYRRMAVDAVDQAARVAGLSVRASATASLRLHGWHADLTRGDDPLSVYGSDVRRLQDLMRECPEWRQRLHPSLPYRAGEVIWAAREEAARSVDDVLARRTRSLFLDARASIEVAPCVADLLATELGRDEMWQEQQVAQFRVLAGGYLPPS